MWRGRSLRGRCDCISLHFHVVQADGKTTIYFRRPTAASDAWDVAMTGNLYILWAYGNAPDIVSARALVGPNASSRVAVALLPKHTAAGAAFANVQSGVWRYADGIYLDPAAVLLCFAAGAAVITGMARLAGLVYTPTDLARPSPATRVAVDFELEEAGSVTSGSVCRSSSFAPLVSPKSRSTADAAVNAGSEYATAAKAPSNASAKDELDEPSIHLSFLNLRRRVPGVDIPAWALLIVLVYVAINIASAYLGISADAASTLGTGPPAHLGSTMRLAEPDAGLLTGHAVMIVAYKARWPLATASWWPCRSHVSRCCGRSWASRTNAFCCFTASSHSPSLC